MRSRIMLVIFSALIVNVSCKTRAENQTLKSEPVSAEDDGHVGAIRLEMAPGLKDALAKNLDPTKLEICMDWLPNLERYGLYDCKRDGKVIPQEEIVVLYFVKQDVEVAKGEWELEIPYVNVKVGKLAKVTNPKTKKAAEHLTELCTGDYAKNCRIKMVDDPDEPAFSSFEILAPLP